MCLCAALLKFEFEFDPGSENSASCYRQGRQLLLTFLTMVTRWSRSTSNFYALIGQNLTGEFMRKIYAASWNLFTLIAEADRVLCQLVTFLTVPVHRIYKKKFSCYQESSVINSWFVYWVFGWEMRLLSKSEIRYRMALFSFFTCSICKGVERSQAKVSGLTWWLSGVASRMVSPSNYCIWCFFSILWSRAQFMRLVYARL